MIDAGNRQRRDDDRADVPDEHHDHDAGEQAAEQQVLFERGDRRVDELRVVADDRTLTPAAAFARSSSSFAWTPSMTATVFSPIARRMSSITAGAPRSQTALVGRSVVSSAWPMSATRIGVPFFRGDDDVLELLGGVDPAERPQQQLALALLDRAARISTFSATTASRTWLIDRPYASSFSMSTTMWISRARPPASSPRRRR